MSLNRVCHILFQQGQEGTSPMISFLLLLNYAWFYWLSYLCIKIITKSRDRQDLKRKSFWLWSFCNNHDWLKPGFHMIVWIAPIVPVVSNNVQTIRTGLFTVPNFFVRSFRYTASYHHGYLNFQMYRGGGRRGL